MGWGKSLGVVIGSVLVLDALSNMTKKSVKQIKKVKIIK
jgi:hypothetical protein